MVEFPVVLTAPSTLAVTVKYAVTGGTATGKGVDFTLANGTVKFNPGETVKIVRFPIINDTRDEADETIQIKLSSPTNSTLANAIANNVLTVTIQDDDAAPSAGFQSSASTGSESIVAPKLTVVLTAASGQTVTVPYSVGGGTATGGGVDFALASGVVTFAPGQTMQTITLAAVNDARHEDAETIAVTLGVPANATLGTNATHTYTIQDNDPASTLPEVNFVADAATATEPASSTAFSLPAVQLSATPTKKTTVKYAVAGGSAKSGSDFTLAAGTLTFTPGGSLTQAIPITLLPDGLDEADETVRITLSSPSNAQLGTVASTTLTLKDDADAPPLVGFALAASTVTEAVKTANLTVTLSAGSGQTVTVPYSVTGGSATAGGVDFTLASGVLTFSPGQTSKTIPLAIVNDKLHELNETVQITLEEPALATLGMNAVHIVTIQDDDPRPKVAFLAASSSAFERIGLDLLPVVLSAATSETVIINYSVTAGGTASAADFVLPAGTLTFAPGETTKNIPLEFVDDGLPEPSETVKITLTLPANPTAVLGTTVVHTATIKDGGSLPTVAFKAAASSALEVAGTTSVVVGLSAATSKTVTVNYSVTGGTATNADFTLTGDTLTFLPGETIKNIPLTIVDDKLLDAKETIQFTLATPTNATLASQKLHTVTIQDDDPVVGFDLLPPAVLVQNPANGLLTNSNVTITGQVTDDFSGVLTLQANVDGGVAANVLFDPSGFWSFTTSLPLGHSADGSHTVQFQATDRANHVSAVTEFDFTLDTTIVSFADPDLADAVREELGIEASEPITTEQLLGLTFVTADSNQIESLGGLENAPNLVSLELTPHDYSTRVGALDLAPLMGLADLEFLTVVGYGLEADDLGVVAQLHGVRLLDLRYNDIQDVAPLAGLRNLESLQLYGNPVTNWDGLAGRPIDVDVRSGGLDHAATFAEVATALYRNPLDIYEFVVNQFEYQPYAGSLKGPQATLQTRAGNAWDQASVLVELLRASGVQTRFVSGRVTASTAEVGAWLGVPEVPLQFFTANFVLDLAGLNSEIGQGSSTITFDHAWVEALVEVPGEGQQWISFDPSWKFKDRQPGIADIFDNVPVDEAGFLSQTREELLVEYYVQQVTDYLNENMPGTSLSEIPFDGPVIAQEFHRVPTQLPYQVVGTPTRQESVPELMKHRILVGLADGATPLLGDVFALPDISLQRMTISHVAAGAGQVRPELRLDGQVIATGSPVDIGKRYSLIVGNFGPGDEQLDPGRQYNFVIEAGEYAALTYDVNQFSSSYMVELQQTVNEAGIAKINGETFAQDDLLGGTLALAGATYFSETDKAEAILDGLTQFVASFNQPGFGLTSSETVVDFFPDLQYPWVPRSASIDVKWDSHDATPIDLDLSSIKPQQRLVLMSASSQEHAVWEELLNTPSVSTVKSLQLANERGIPVFVINSSNAATLIPQLTISAADVTKIQSLVAAGATVTVSRDPTPLLDWNGVGYIIDDPVASRLSFSISGGLNSEASRLTFGGFSTGDPLSVTLVPKGNNPDQTMVGDPINIANGNVTRDEQDIQLPGIGLSLDFERHYDTQSNVDRGLGIGWSFDYSDFLSFPDDGTNSIIWTTDRGLRFTFTSDGTGGYSVPINLYGTFTETEAGFTYREKDGLTHEFDLQGHLISIRDRNGNELQLTYNAQGRLAAVIDGDAPQRRLDFTYTAEHITTIRDFTGRIWTYNYSGSFLTSVTGPADARTAAYTVRYDYFTDSTRNGLLRQITQPDGGTIRYSYYANRRGFEVTDPEGFTHSVSYNLYRDRARFVDERGFETFHDYNAVGNEVRVVRPDLSTEFFLWEDGLMLARLDPFAQAEFFLYDEDGNTTVTLDRAGIVTQYEYDPVFANVTRVTRPGGRVTDFTYDAAGNLVRTQDALGIVTTMTYDSRGLLLSRTSPLGNLTADPQDHTTTYRYNDAGQVLEQATDLPSVEMFSYDPRGNVASRTDANWKTTTFQNDLLGRVLVVTDALGQATSFTYDVIGNPISSRDSLGRVTNFSYDQRQLLVRAVNADGTITTASYDPVRNLVAATDEFGRITQFDFDAKNRQVAAYYPDGASMQFSFDSRDQLIRQRDPRGNETRYSYDAAGRLVRTTDALGKTTRFTYDAVGNRSAITDRRGAVTTYTYDLLDRVTQTRGENGFVMTTDFDANGNVVATTRYDVTGLAGIPDNPRTLPTDLQRQTRLLYDVLDRPIEMIDPAGQSRRTRYDAGGRIIETIDELGRHTTLEYDALDRVTASVNPIGGRSKFEYDSEGNLIAVIDELGRRTTFEYDLRDRLTQATDPLGGVTINTYDAVGNAVAVTDALGRTTRFFYDERNRQTFQVDPLDGVTELAYDAAGNLIAIFDELGRLTFLSYDALNRLEFVVNPDDSSLAYQYDAEGNLIRLIDQRDNEWQYSYDLLGRRIGTTDPLGGMTSTVYDALGHAVSYTDELDRLTTFEYDRLDRQTTVTDPLLHSTVTTFDDVGNVIATTDPLGQTSTFGYDNLNRLVTTTDARGGTVVMTYDAVGNLLSITDPVTNTTSYEYDALDRRIRDTNSLGDSRTFTYDAVGNRLSATDRNGRRREFRHDALDRMVEERWLDGTGNTIRSIESVYDAADQLLLRGDAESAYAFAYDAMGRVASVSNADTPGAPLVVLSYQYDPAGNLLTRGETINGDAGATTDYRFDSLNRMDQITQSGPSAAPKRIELRYDAASQWDSITRYADLAETQLVASSDYTYDDAGRLSRLSHFGPSVSGSPTPVLAEYQYSFDAADRITQIVSPDGTSTYAYDETDQLTATDHTFQSDESFSYDLNGNRTNSGYQTGSNNRLLSDGTFTYEYDAEGNRTRRTAITSGEVTEYTWDYRNRLTGVVVRSADGSVLRQAAYTYDVFNRRLSTTVDADGAGPASSQVEHFVYDGDHIALSFDDAGTMTHRYLHGPVIDQIFADENAMGDVIWPLTDHLGTVRDFADSTGQIANHRTYDSFGQLVAETNPAVDHLFTFTGRELDSSTGLLYYRARWYDPAVRRFLSEDPIGFSGGDSNLNRYVRNDPVSYQDPFGEEAQSTVLEKTVKNVKKVEKGLDFIGRVQEKAKKYDRETEEDAKRSLKAFNERPEIMAIAASNQAMASDLASRNWGDKYLNQKQNPLRPVLSFGNYIRAVADTAWEELPGVKQVRQGKDILESVEANRVGARVFGPKPMSLFADRVATVRSILGLSENNGSPPSQNPNMAATAIGPPDDSDYIRSEAEPIFILASQQKIGTQVKTPAANPEPRRDSGGSDPQFDQWRAQSPQTAALIEQWSPKGQQPAFETIAVNAGSDTP